MIERKRINFILNKAKKVDDAIASCSAFASSKKSK